MGWFSDLFGDDDEDDAQDLYKKAAANYNSLVPPSLSSTALKLGRMVSEGDLTPEEAVAQLQQESEMAGITVDPALYKAQLDALTSLQDIGMNGGLTAMDKAQLFDISNEEATKERGAREAILQGAAQRGVAGSGLELAQQLISQQSSADRASARGTEVAAQAQKRALEAIQNAGQLSTGMRTQAFGEESTKAQAQDAINRFNTEMANKVNMANIAAKNAAAETNLNNKYKVQEYNLGQQSAEEQARVNQLNTNYQQQLQKAAGQSGTLSASAGSQATSDAISSANWANVGGKVLATKWGQDALTGVANTVSGWFSDENLKKDTAELTSDQVDDLLDNLTGYSYRYKDSNKPGVGVMAQDLEQTPLEDSVVDTPKGKMVVDDGAISSAMLAALANINSRVKNLEGK